VVSDEVHPENHDLSPLVQNTLIHVIMALQAVDSHIHIALNRLSELDKFCSTVAKESAKQKE